MRQIDLTGIDGYQGLSRIWDVLPQARLVGGSVRDLLREKTPQDLDLATPEPPGDVMARLEAAGARTVPTGLSHGTITAVIDSRPFEITTLRRDEQTDGRHAVVSWTQDWREDASRRDFTINAMFCDRHGAIYDYFDGLDDLTAERVRFVGEARLRIEEDALRILRFFRFSARFATCLDPDALGAIQGRAHLIAGLSRERIASEMLRLLEGPRAVEMLRAMEACGALAFVVATDAVRMERLERLIAWGLPVDGVLRLGALARDPAAAAREWRLSNANVARLEALPGDMPHPKTDDDGLRIAMFDSGAAVLSDRVWLARDESAAWDGLLARIAAQPRPVFPLAGRDAVAAGMTPGPSVGAALRDVTAWWRAGGCMADRAACLARLRDTGV